MRNSAAAELELVAGLGSVVNFEADLSVQGRDDDLRAQRRLHKGHRHLAKDVVSLPLKEGMRPHRHGHMEVAGRAAVGTGVAAASHRKHLSVVDAGRHGNLQVAGAADASLSRTGRAGILDDPAGAAAALAGALRLHLAEGRALDLRHAAPPVAGRTGDRRRAFSGSAAAAVGTAFHDGHADGFLTALGRLLEGEVEVGLGVRSPTGRVGVGALAAEAAAENAPKDVAQILEAEPAAIAAATVTAAGPEVGIDAGVAELVVTGFLILIGQNLVGLVDLLKFGLGLLVARVQVGVIFLGRLSVGLFDLVIPGASVYAQDLIIISLIRQRVPRSSGLVGSGFTYPSRR